MLTLQDSQQRPKTTADKKITTTLIKKDVVQNFSYADHSIGWQITVNPNHIPLENGVVTDPLPEGNGFASIEAATLTKKNEDGTTTEVSSTLTDKQEQVELIRLPMERLQHGK